jgi:hypothetical protein
LATDNAVAQQSRDWGATLIETLPWPDAVSDNQSPRQQLQKMPLNSWTESTNFPRASTQDFACRLTSLAERVVGRLPPCSLADVVAARLRELGARAGDPVVARVAAEIAAWCEPARDAA